MACKKMIFSQRQSDNRVEKAMRVLPTPVLNRILFFALHLLGARLNSIADFLKIPEESVKTTIGRIMRDGLDAFRDRRLSAEFRESPLPPPSRELRVSVSIEEEDCVVNF